jgi:hypothetical protein
VTPNRQEAAAVQRLATETTADAGAAALAAAGDTVNTRHPGAGVARRAHVGTPSSGATIDEGR